MLFLAGLILVLAFLFAEKAFHERRLRRIPIRIHVNGTRGKSSVVRLIASGLREAGIRTCAKTTGDRPNLIYPDGSEEFIRRRGRSRIQEQMEFIRKAAREKAEAVVVECMAIDPQLQWISEHRMIRSTLGVITNVRLDHLEVMGKDRDEIAGALSATIPENGVLVTGEQQYLERIGSVAVARHTRVYAPVSESDGSKGLEPHDENLLIARKVLDILGIPWGCLSRSRSKPGLPCTPSLTRIRIEESSITFADAFSVNDVDSMKLFQRTLIEKECPRPFVALLNNRADRPLRMLSFASFLTQEPLYDHIMLTGENRRLARRAIERRCSGKVPLVLESKQPKGILEEILEAVAFKPQFTICGMGNRRGIGEALSNYFRAQDRL
jgi:gamma-polyglutamate synthase